MAPDLSVLHLHISNPFTCQVRTHKPLPEAVFFQSPNGHWMPCELGQLRGEKREGASWLWRRGSELVGGLVKRQGFINDKSNSSSNKNNNNNDNNDYYD